MILGYFLDLLRPFLDARIEATKITKKVNLCTVHMLYLDRENCGNIMEDQQTSPNVPEHSPLIIKPSEETIPEQDELPQIKGMYLSVCLSVRPSVCLSISPSIWQSIWQSVSQSICLSVRL